MKSRVDPLSCCGCRAGGADGVSVISLSGHGVEFETDGAFYCPFDAHITDLTDAEGKVVKDNDGNDLIQLDRTTLVSMKTLLKTLKFSPSGNKLLLADCCRSSPTRARPKVLTDKSSAFGSSVKTSDLPLNAAAIFACRARESAFEGPSIGHGAMTKVLLKLLATESEVTTLLKPLVRDVALLVKNESGNRKTQTVSFLTTGLVDLQLNIGPKFEGKTPGEERTISGIKFCWIPAGSFTMGSPPDEEDRSNNEEHVQVRLTRGFWLGQYVTTQAEYERVMGSNPSYFSASGDGKDKVAGMDTSRFPVETASWNDAMEYCDKLTAEAHSRGELPKDWKYTLPTEAQWEYACRAGTRTPFHFGEILNGKQANMNGNYPYSTEEKGPYLERTARVGSYPANAWNLYDMHGNVWEWCQDFGSVPRTATVTAGSGWPQFCPVPKKDSGPVLSSVADSGGREGRRRSRPDQAGARGVTRAGFG